MLNEIKGLADVVFERVVTIRRKIHRRPELAFEEFETSKLVADVLSELGLDITTEVARTGVVANLRGGRPGPVTAVRADMDALPITEENTFGFASEIPGKMHACGHDAHTSSLLGAAMILSRIREELSGSVRFMFQPSEERIPGGAKFMIEEGALGEASSVFGQHVTPRLEAGSIGIRPGMYMSSVDELHLTVRGEGGHAAEPHNLSSDAVVVASHIVIALQTVVSRNSPPDLPSILSIGRIMAEGATNIIPSTVKLEGTFRAMDESWRERAYDLIERVATGTARAHGAECEVDIRKGYPALNNDAELAAWLRDAATEYVGEDKVVDLDPWFASEDFAYFAQRVPGAFYRLGTGNRERGIVHGLHTPKFTVDEEALRTGAGFMAYLCWARGASMPAE
jgi:hippurate hydrolase